MSPAQITHQNLNRDWLPRWLAERGFHSTGPGTFSNGRAQFQMVGNQLTALPGDGTVAWREDIARADTAHLQFLLQNLVNAPGFQSQIQIDRQVARREHAAAALHLVTTTITESPDSHAGVHLRRFLWSMYNGPHAMSLWRLRDNLGPRHQGAVTLLFAAWTQGTLPDDTLRQALTDCGEMDRWDASASPLLKKRSSPPPPTPSPNASRPSPRPASTPTSPEPTPSCVRSWIAWERSGSTLFKMALKDRQGDAWHRSHPSTTRPIEAGRETGLEPSERVAETGIAAPQQQIVFVVHDENRVVHCSEILRKRGDHTEEPAPVVVVAVDCRPSVGTAHHVAPSLRHMDLQRPNLWKPQKPLPCRHYRNESIATLALSCAHISIECSNEPEGRKCRRRAGKAVAARARIQVVAPGSAGTLRHRAPAVSALAFGASVPLCPQRGDVPGDLRRRGC